MSYQELLARFDPPIQELARMLRERLLQQIPGAVETVDDENIGLGFGTGYKGLVFVITPRPGYVMLGIAGGASFSDPEGLLQGKGKVHRHIKFHRISDLENPALEPLIQSAVEAARARPN
jgi:hypothetical protein